MLLNFSGTNGGGWSRNGCTKAPSNFTHTVCKCHHLTSFAVVSDLRIEVGSILPFGTKFCVYVRTQAHNQKRLDLMQVVDLAASFSSGFIKTVVFFKLPQVCNMQDLVQLDLSRNVTVAEAAYIM